MSDINAVMSALGMVQCACGQWGKIKNHPSDKDSGTNWIERCVHGCYPGGTCTYNGCNHCMRGHLSGSHGM